MTDAAALLAVARERLRTADAPRERLGEIRRRRRLLGVGRSARIVPVGSAWHLGVLLVTDDGVAATGEIIRARQEAVRGVTAENQRRRAGLSAAARRGGFGEGETVHLAWQTLDLAALARGGASGPLDADGGVVHVAWSSKAAPMPLEQYLDERVELLVHPPEGAS